MWPFVRVGGVKVTSAPDRRRRTLQLTKAGERQVARTIPHWKQAQQRILKLVGAAKWDALGGDLLSLAQSVRTTDDRSRLGVLRPGRRS